MKLHKLPPAGDAEPVPIEDKKIISGAPITRTWVHYEDPETKRAAGIWEATPGKWRIAYAEWEYVVMISGSCIIASDNGEKIEAGPGDAFVIEPGFNGTWEVLETMRKHWVIQE